MICFEMVDIEAMPQLVEFGFFEDSDLYKYQPISESLERSVERIVDRLKASDKILNLSYYKVLWKGTLVGYTVLDIKEQLLYSFAINIYYRVKDIVVAWFNEVNNIFSGVFGCILWSTNKRAINFLINNGMKILDINSETVFLIKT